MVSRASRVTQMTSRPPSVQSRSRRTSACQCCMPPNNTRRCCPCAKATALFPSLRPNRCIDRCTGCSTAYAHRVADELGLVMETELFHGVGAVACNGVLAQEEPRGDLVGRKPLADQR